MPKYADPRCYNTYEERRKAALERRDLTRLYCRGCRMETGHAHGSRFAYCLRCLRNHP